MRVAFSVFDCLEFALRLGGSRAGRVGLVAVWVASWAPDIHDLPLGQKPEHCRSEHENDSQTEKDFCHFYEINLSA